MKITNTNIETVPPSSTSGAAGGSSANRLAKDGKTDSVTLSNASQLVNLAKAVASPGRAAKVASVAALVRSGQYSADTASVSHAVIEGHIS